MNKRKIWHGIILAVMLVSLATSAFAASYKTLRYRDEGSAVQQMQQALVSLGYSTGGVDGKYGPTTEKAVRQFQRDNGLKVDGVAGNQTQSLLYAKVNDEVPSAPTAAPDTSTGGSTGSTVNGSSIFGGNYDTLKYGSRGDRVKILQKALNDLGFAAGSADGKFGTGTQRAVVAFQQANGLEADGKAGSRTLKKLEAQLAGDTGNDTVVTAPPTAAPAATPAPTASTGNSYNVPTRTLRKGYQGEDVKSVQSRLKELGYYTGSIDGKYGSGTMAAVKSFQQKNGLTADGLAGSATYRVLFSSNAKPLNGATAAPTATPTPAVTPAPDVDTDTGYIIPNRTLRKNYEGEDVKSVQRRLRELGFYNGSIDGKYGTGTMEAVRLFQQKNGLTADGLAGANTYRILYSDDALPAATTPTPAPTAVPDTTVTLRKGNTGAAVQQLQNALVELGYKVNTNGTYNNETASAVKEFQAANGLIADGVAGPNTLGKLYSGSAVGPNSGATDTLPPGTGTSVAIPNIGQVELLHWQNDIKPTLKAKAHFLIVDPATGLSWTLQLLSAGRHADSEPLTATDTAVMFKAFGNQNTWTQKPVYVRLPDGRWTIGATHNTPHLSGNIKDNDFDGHLCLHLLRDMSEAEKNDPKYGVSNQNTIRAFWKSLTGQDIPYK